ncbi:MAG: hypothetical protein R2856_07790 [Caldilineaceae bacterium]
MLVTDDELTVGVEWDVAIQLFEREAGIVQVGAHVDDPADGPQ